ncbi:MAG: hypothetical protein ACJAZO_005395 [Myxococcota bacterium]|jgi:hypothetical protein
MSFCPTRHPPVDWLALRQLSELSSGLSLIVDCHRSICESCDVQATGLGAPALLDRARSSTGLPRVLAEWLDRAPHTQWNTTAEGIERMTLSELGRSPVWLERRAPTGQNGGWDGDGECFGVILAGAVSVDGSRLSRGDVLASCTERTVIRVVSPTAAVLLRGCAGSVTDDTLSVCATGDTSGVGSHLRG